MKFLIYSIDSDFLTMQFILNYKCRLTTTYDNICNTDTRLNSSIFETPCTQLI